MLKAISLALAVIALSACGRHPMMLCSQVGPNMLACADYRDYKDMQDESEKKAPQRHDEQWEDKS